MHSRWIDGTPAALVPLALLAACMLQKAGICARHEDSEPGLLGGAHRGKGRGSCRCPELVSQDVAPPQRCFQRGAARMSQGIGRAPVAARAACPEGHVSSEV